MGQLPVKQAPIRIAAWDSSPPLWSITGIHSLPRSYFPPSILGSVFCPLFCGSLILSTRPPRMDKPRRIRLAKNAAESPWLGDAVRPWGRGGWGAAWQRLCCLRGTEGSGWGSQCSSGKASMLATLSCIIQLIYWQVFPSYLDQERAEMTQNRYW